MGRIIALANQKGGVGKTTTVVNLAASLALKNRSVAVLDIDPQGNATSGLGVDKNAQKRSLYDVFMSSADAASVLVDTEIITLKLGTANGDLVAAEVDLAGRDGRESVLKNAIRPLTSDYDYIFIDCPPSLGFLTLNALVAADSVLVPLQCEYYALEGISALMDTIEVVRTQLNPELEIEGVVATMYDGRTNLSRQVYGEAKKYFKDALFKTPVPRNVRISESPSFGKPIVLYDAISAGALAYDALADELEKRLKKKQNANTSTSSNFLKRLVSNQ